MNRCSSSSNAADAVDTTGARCRGDERTFVVEPEDRDAVVVGRLAAAAFGDRAAEWLVARVQLDVAPDAELFGMALHERTVLLAPVRVEVLARPVRGAGAEERDDDHLGAYGIASGYCGVTT